MPIYELHSGLLNNARIVQLILANDPIGGELLYRQYARGLSFLAKRHSPDHAEDCLHDTLICVIEQIKAGKLSAPAALPSYLATILKRTAWNRNLESKKRAGDQNTFNTAVSTYQDEREGPFQQVELKERARLMEDGLRQLKSKEREVLTRFYLQEQTPEVICAAMGLTETQFRLLKCRSKQLLEKCIAQVTHRLASEKKLLLSLACSSNGQLAGFRSQQWLAGQENCRQARPNERTGPPSPLG